MKFIISRTSATTEEKPCEGTEREYIETYDERICSMKEAKARGWFEQWFNKTHSHEEIGEDKIRGIANTKWLVWTMEINTLKELMKFEEKNGNIIISNSWLTPVDESLKEIEIYDGYRE